MIGERGGRRSDNEPKHVPQPEHGSADVHVELCRVDATPEHRCGDGRVTVGAAAGRPSIVAAAATLAAVFFASRPVLLVGVVVGTVLPRRRNGLGRLERHLHTKSQIKVGLHSPEPLIKSD